jgi:ribosome biogenesis protein ENP2
VVYDEYKFVSKQEVFELGCENLVNTKMLKEYMHGYLMHLKLFNKLKDKLHNADLLEKRKRKIDELVNQDLPKKIEVKESVQDSRFQINDNPDFEINRFSEDYMIRHPHLKKQLEKEKVEHTKQLEK